MDIDAKSIRDTSEAVRVAAVAVTMILRDLRDRGITIELPLIGIIPIKVGPAVKQKEGDE